MQIADDFHAGSAALALTADLGGILAVQKEGSIARFPINSSTLDLAPSRTAVITPDSLKVTEQQTTALLLEGLLAGVFLLVETEPEHRHAAHRWTPETCCTTQSSS